MSVPAAEFLSPKESTPVPVHKTTTVPHDLEEVRITWPTGESEVFKVVEARMITGHAEPYLVILIPIQEGEEDEPA